MKVNFLGSRSCSEDPDTLLVACGIPRLNHLIQDESLQSQLHQCEDVPSTRPQTTAKSRHSVTITSHTSCLRYFSVLVLMSISSFCTHTLCTFRALGASVCATCTHSCSSSQLWSVGGVCARTMALLVSCKILCKVCCEDCASTMFWTEMNY